VSDLTSLLTRGYFPKELPPPFKTVSFGQAVASAPAEFRDLSHNLSPAQLAHHNLARPGNVYRRLGIPNPAKHLPLCDFIAAHWTELATAASKGTLSLSSPTPSVIGRALNPRVLLGNLAEHRTMVRAGKRYVLTADIARFYPSIYTHSIPWALHSKAVSKSNKTGALLGNILDKLVRSSQDGQTVGIPIGPDTSLLIAELVMSAVDHTLESRIDVTGYRYIDDIELAFGTAAQADAALGPLQETLGDYELALNPIKTQIERLPGISEERWISQLRDFHIRKKALPQKLDLIKYFDLAFALAREFPNKSVLSYAVAKLRTTVPDDANSTLAQDLILQSLVNEAGVTRFALEMLIRYRATGVSLDIDKLGAAISTVIEHHGPLLHRSEVAWAVWGAIALKISLPDSTVRLAVAGGDSVVTLLALDAHSRGLVGFDLQAELAVQIGKESFGSERWLLLYEAIRHGWLDEAEVLQSDSFTPFFEKLEDADVCFYDSDVELAKIDRPLDQLHGINMPVLGFVFGY
jgi:hypothetical protein